MIDFTALQTVLKTKLEQREHSLERLSPTELRTYAQRYLVDYCSADSKAPLSAGQRSMIDVTVSEALGLGVLEALLQDERVTEIMVNNAREVFVEINGRIEKSTAAFSSTDSLLRIIERIVMPLGRRIDLNSPMVDARLADGSRVNAIIPPLAISGPCLTIRKFSTRKLQLQDLAEHGALTRGAITYLHHAVAQRANILIAGGTGSGKTTLLNALATQIPAEQRIITIEDAAELQLGHPHTVILEARPDNQEGQGSVSIRELLRNALRMRPDRIIVGECRGAETLDMLQAMSTGHHGSFSTVHANNAREALKRLEMMVLMSGIELPTLAIRQQIASAIQVIVQVERAPSGQRRVASIHEVVGLEGDVVQVAELFKLSNQQLVFSGMLPLFFDALPVDSRSNLAHELSQ